jgi:uncharacterized protein YchJ
MGLVGLVGLVGLASSPETLMRARYTAYATGPVSHILRTTHAGGPQHQADAVQWRQSVTQFCDTYVFSGPCIHSHSEKGATGYVHFTASLEPAGELSLLDEHSVFYKVGEQWLYWGAKSLG